MDIWVGGICGSLVWGTIWSLGMLLKKKAK